MMINLSNTLKKKNNKKGFTLIELIVVIAILGILAAVAIPRLTGFQETAREKSHKSNLATLTSAAEIAVAEHGAPAANVTWTAGTTGDGVLGTGVYLRDNFVSQWPASPWTDGDAYTVTITGTTGEINVTGGTVTP